MAGEEEGRAKEGEEGGSASPKRWERWWPDENAVSLLPKETRRAGKTDSGCKISEKTRGKEGCNRRARMAKPPRAPDDQGASEGQPIPCCHEKRLSIFKYSSQRISLRTPHFIHLLFPTSFFFFLQTRPENATFSFQTRSKLSLFWGVCVCVRVYFVRVCFSAGASSVRLSLASAGEMAPSSPPLPSSLCGLISISKSCDPAGKTG